MSMMLSNEYDCSGDKTKNNIVDSIVRSPHRRRNNHPIERKKSLPYYTLLVEEREHTYFGEKKLVFRELVIIRIFRIKRQAHHSRPYKGQRMQGQMENLPSGCPLCHHLFYNHTLCFGVPGIDP